MSDLSLPEEGDIVRADTIVALVRRAHWEQKIGESGSSTTPYQLLTNNDSGTWMCKVNPGTTDSSTGFLYDPHWNDTVIDDPAWTKIAIDSSGQIPCWVGDWVDCVPCSVVVPGYEEYGTVLIQNRRSQQLQFWAQLDNTKLYYESAAAATVFINGAAHARLVWDNDLLKPNQWVAELSIGRVGYDPDARQFYWLNSPCGTVFSP